MGRAVRFNRYGGVDELYLAEVGTPVPGPGDVVVDVRAAGINPGEIAIREGYLDSLYPSTFPSGEGSDLAGVVSAVGSGVTDFAVGDEVLGWSWDRSSHADQVRIPAAQLIAKPTALSWPVAGGLYVVAATAYAAVRAVSAQAGETVAVSAAAGGVGTVVVQLLRQREVNVIGIASSSNQTWLSEHGVTLVEYGDGLADRLRAAAPQGIDAFIDLFGPEYVRLAVDLGISPQRIETIIAMAEAKAVGAKAEGSGDATTTEVLTEMADLVAQGHLEIPIAATYPLEQVQQAYTDLARRHTRGKIVLIP